MLYPRLKHSARMKKLAHAVYLCEQHAGISTQLMPIAGYVLALCTGEMSTDTITRCIAATYTQPIAESQEFLQGFLDTHAAYLDFLDTPIPNPTPRYDFEDFDYYPQPFNGRFHTPVDAKLVLTGRCNFRCHYCHNRSQPPNLMDMSTDQWLDAVGQMKQLGVLKIDLKGGEPFLHPGFAEIFDAVNTSDMLATIHTNGSLITHEWIDRLKNTPDTIVQISLDALTGTKDSSARITETIHTLAKAGVHVRCQALMLPENYHEAQPLIDLCEQLGARSLMLDTYDLCCIDRVNAHYLLTQPQSDSITDIVNQKKSTGGMPVTFHPGPKRWHDENDIITCGALSEGFSLLANGTFTLCEKTATDPHCAIGRFPEHSLEQLWNSPRIESILRPSRAAYTQTCHDCEHLFRCHAGCPAMRRIVSPNAILRGPDPRCWQAHYKHNPLETAWANPT